mmetsp:Transcript_65920/g.121574  ORF Transcript_65920/g.121574 Transcript_65920/m.121574 type:complete len:639 (-) Transcript_65920:124-2040(-)
MNPYRMMASMACSQQWTCTLAFLLACAAGQCGFASASGQDCAQVTDVGLEPSHLEAADVNELLSSHIALSEFEASDDYGDDDMADDHPAFMQGAVLRRNTSKEAAVASDQEARTAETENARLQAAKAEAMKAETAALQASEAAAAEVAAAQARASKAESAVLQTARAAAARIEDAKAKAAKAEAVVAETAKAELEAEASSDTAGDSPALVQGAVLRHTGPAGRGLPQEPLDQSSPQGLGSLPENLGIIEAESPLLAPQFPLRSVPRAPARDEGSPRPVMPEPLVERPAATSLEQIAAAVPQPLGREAVVVAATSPAVANASVSGQNSSADLVKFLPPDHEYYRIRELLAGGLAVVLILAFALGCLLRRYVFSKARFGSDASTRRRVEKLRISSGTEIRSMFAMKAPAPERPNPALPLRPGMLMRVQGRVVARPGCTMMAPLSGRACVMYSASASQHQHGGVHQAPVAYHSATSGFGIELDNLPDAVLDVRGEDVLLFDMEGGRFAQEEHFSEAPEAWRAFVMAHLLTGSGGECRNKMNHVDLAAKGLLEFRECALVVGAMVTCVGEVSREGDGRLTLGPWSPPTTPTSSSPSSAMVSRAVPWMTPDSDVLVQRLMVSDDLSLLDKAPPWQTLAQTLLQ